MVIGLHQWLISATCLPRVLRKLTVSTEVQGTIKQGPEKNQARPVNPEPLEAVMRWLLVSEKLNKIQLEIAQAVDGCKAIQAGAEPFRSILIVIWGHRNSEPGGGSRLTRFAARAIAITNCAFESLRQLMNERRVVLVQPEMEKHRFPLV